MFARCKYYSTKAKQLSMLSCGIGSAPKGAATSEERTLLTTYVGVEPTHGMSPSQAACVGMRGALTLAPLAASRRARSDVADVSQAWSAR